MLELFAGILLYCQSNMCFSQKYDNVLVVIACATEAGSSQLYLQRKYVKNEEGVIILAVYYQSCPQT